jgi:hypothetical protein
MLISVIAMLAAGFGIAGVLHVWATNSDDPALRTIRESFTEHLPSAGPSVRVYLLHPRFRIDNGHLTVSSYSTHARVGDEDGIMTGSRTITTHNTLHIPNGLVADTTNVHMLDIHYVHGQPSAVSVEYTDGTHVAHELLTL